MAARVASPSPSRLSSYNDEEGNLTTIPDPRSRTMSPANGESGSPPHHPDLSDEVAALSTKLINAINHQTNLDDTLNATRHELETARERIKHLEKDAEEHTSRVASGVLISASVAQGEKSKLLAALGEERKQRAEVEKEKKRIEQELENLTAALFEEANKMVITARESAQREHEVVQKNNDQLKSQLADTESLLKLHQEQLAELKQVMEQMTAERDDQSNCTAPSTPGVSKFDKDEIVASPDDINSASSVGDLSPSYPTSFTHLLHPVLRTDLAAYDDFTALLRMAKGTAPGSRVSSGSYNGLGLGLGLGGHQSAMSTVANQIPSNGSTSSLATSAAFSSNPGSPTTPASSVSASSTGSSTQVPLKETRFYKRALAEDIEPTLRLDTAPGLSWLARRSVLNAMCEGNLVVEPMPTPTTTMQKLYVFPCALCGETRKDKEHARTHRFRTSESDNAQRYPLCKYCLGRVRSSCDFLGFLRMLRDGHWRTDDEGGEKSAWEESVRLREQMFWSRMGGGVIPVGAPYPQHGQTKSSRTSEEAETIREIKKDLSDSDEFKPKDITPATEPDTTTEPDEAGNEAFLAKRRAEKLKEKENDESADGLWQASQADAEVPPAAAEEKEPEPVEAVSSEVVERTKPEATEPVKSEPIESNRNSTQSLTSGESGRKGEQRLSITIPGSFD